MQERWVRGLLVVAVVGLGPGDSHVDMARAGVFKPGGRKKTAEEASRAQGDF